MGRLHCLESEDGAAETDLEIAQQTVENIVVKDVLALLLPLHGVCAV